MIKPSKMRRCQWYRTVVSGLLQRGFEPLNEVEAIRRRVFKHQSLDVTVSLQGGHRLVLTVSGVTREPIVAESLKDVFDIVAAAELDAEFPD